MVIRPALPRVKSRTAATYRDSFEYLFWDGTHNTTFRHREITTLWALSVVRCIGDRLGLYFIVIGLHRQGGRTEFIDIGARTVPGFLIDGHAHPTALDKDAYSKDFSY